MERVNIILFSCILAAFFSMAVILPPDGKAAESENLRGMPELNLESLKNNSFPTDFEDYLSDNTAFRSAIISVSRKLDGLQGLTPSEGLVRKTEKYVLWSDRIMEVFYNKPEIEGRYAEVLNGIRAELPPEITVYSMLIPTQAEFFLEKKYKNLSESQKTAIDYVNERLADNIISVNCYSALEERADEYIYFRTDHHWTALGAYYAYEAFCESAGISAVPLEDYNEHKAENFFGYLFNSDPAEILEDNADIIYYYTLKDESFKTSQELIAEREQKYTLFIQGDRDYFDVTTSVNNGRTAIVVKDSYANCFIPFLAPHYERLIVLDPRRFENPFSIADEAALYTAGEVDVIFLNYIFTATFEDVVETINSIK